MTVIEQILSKYLKEIGCGSCAEELLDYNPDEVIKAVIKGFKKWLQQKKGYYSGDTYKTAYKVVDELLEELER